MLDPIALAIRIIRLFGSFAIRKAHAPDWTLAQLLAQVTADNLHGEVDTGRAVGKEAW